jgi:hypothetical protein
MTVWVDKRGGKTPSVYHTEEDCQSVEHGETMRPFDSVEDLHWDIPECQWCSGEASRGGCDMSYVVAARNEDPDEFGEEV